MKVSVFAKAGTIAQGRWVRFTGVIVDGAYEVEIVGPSRRAHALVLPHPKSAISKTDFGHACPLGPIHFVEAGATVSADDDLTPNTDGTVRKAPKGDDRCVGVAVTGASKGKAFPMLLRWTGRP